MKLLSKKIIDWYQHNKRELPWRETTDPYLIWVSEIILQQTRVNQGISYYLRFVENFPAINKLAQADEDEVLKYWQGLGYYSRARNMLKAARKIFTEYDGVFPRDYHTVLKLPGIGVYTSAAICSFAYNDPYSVVDGNVYRVFSRLYGIRTPIDSSVGVKQFADLAQKHLDKKFPGLYNQALMEFGALQCVPVSPDCSLCPLIDNCTAYQQDLISTLPVKQQKVKVKERFFNYFFVQFGDNTFLKKRDKPDIWKNLYEFPLIESDHLITSDTLFSNEDFLALFSEIDDIEIFKISSKIKHVLSHRIIYATFITVRIKQKNKIFEEYKEVPLNEIEKYAVSRLIEIFLESSIK